MPKRYLQAILVLSYTLLYVLWLQGEHGLTLSILYALFAASSAVTYHNIQRIWNISTQCNCEDDVIRFGLVHVAVASILYLPISGMPIVVIMLLYVSLYTSSFLKNTRLVPTVPVHLLLK